MEQSSDKVVSGLRSTRFSRGLHDDRVVLPVEDLGHPVGQTLTQLTMLISSHLSEVAVPPLELVALAELNSVGLHVGPGVLVAEILIGFMKFHGLGVNILAEGSHSSQLIGLFPDRHRQGVVLEARQATRAVTGNDLGVDGAESDGRGLQGATGIAIRSLRRQRVVGVSMGNWRTGDGQTRDGHGAKNTERSGRHGVLPRGSIGLAIPSLIRASPPCTADDARSTLQ